MGEAFDAAVRDLSGSFGGQRSYCAPFLTLLPVTGAAVSTIGSLIAPETLCATDGDAARLDEVQFDLGEGPCWEVKATRLPVLERDIRASGRGAWPAFTEAVRDLPVRGLYAFPLTIGGLDVGVIDLYSSAAGDLDGGQARDAAALAEVAAREVLRELVARIGDESDDDATGFSRRAIHQATGMVIAQLDVSPADAGLMLRAHAFASGRAVREVADDVLRRRLDFSAGIGDGVGS